MPSDIRSFFGGGRPSQDTPKDQNGLVLKRGEIFPTPGTTVSAYRIVGAMARNTANQALRPSQNGITKKKGRSSRRVVEDDSDDEPVTKKGTPKKRKAEQHILRSPSHAGEATTTSDYFATNGKNKPKRSEASKVKTPSAKKEPATPAKAASAKSTPKSKQKQPSVVQTPNSRTPTRGKKTKSYVEIKSEEEDAFLNEEANDDDDVIPVNVRKPSVKHTSKVLRTDDREYEADQGQGNIHLKKESIGKATQGKVKKEDEDFEPGQDVVMRDVLADDDFLDPDDDERILTSKPAKPHKPAPKAGRKRKTLASNDESDGDAPPSNKTPKKTPAKKRAKKEKDDAPENPEMQAIFDSIPMVRPPTPPKQSDDDKKFDFRANTGPAPAADSPDMPVGAENCLAGLSFVFTGILEHLGREAGQQLVKRYGGKVTTAPSSRTSYVVLGNEAGPRKLEIIRKFNIKTINEEGLFELIRRLPANGGDSKAAAKHDEKKRAEEDAMKQQAAEMEKEERRAAAAAAARGADRGKAIAGISGTDSRLWTVKYAPTQLAHIVGNKTQVEKLQKWLRMFPKNQQKDFKLAGADGSGTYRAVMIHGPPGIGKTTAAHLVAKIEGYDIVETNASDTRSKKLVETGLKGVLSTTSLLGYFAGDGQEVEAGKKQLVLIMDEVDGMSAGDRGGVGALAAVCKKTQIPMILICNDRKLPKMKPFDYCTYDLPFRRPTTDQIKSRIMTIAWREGLKLPPTVIEALIEGNGADIRQIVNMVSTVKLDQQAMDYDKGKAMSKAWEKHVILKPWDIVGKILGGGMFASSSKATLNDKIELYFNDHEFSHLMLQENYLGTNPTAASSYSGKERNLKLLELVDKAAESISDGDLVDRMIHGSQQQWSLMPTHAVFSFVRPASFVAGSMAGHRTGFAQWLGKNATQGRLSRAVKEIHGHMRLRSSGDRHEVRQQYIPVLWLQLIKKLELQGKEYVPEVIALLDSYFLTREDWEAIMELGVGPMDMETVKLDSQTKATFTRLYNQQSHPLPFMKASNVGAPKKVAKEKPDLEEAIEESDEGEVVEEVKEAEQDEDMDLTKDKYVKQPKKKAAGKVMPQKSSAKGKKKARDDEDADAVDTSDEEHAKTKKGRNAAKSTGPAKGKGKKR